MKKLFGVLTVVALIATAAFAQEEAEGLSFSSSGQAVWTVVANSRTDSGDPIAVGGLQLPWGDPTAGPRTALTVKGTSEHVGFWLDIYANGNGITIGDNALIWVKPFSWARLVFAGAHDENVGRSGAAWGLWDWDRIGVYKSKAAANAFIFPDLLDKTISVELRPVEGLLIGGAINLPLGKDGTLGAANNEARYGGLPHPSYNNDNETITVAGGVHGSDSAWTLLNIFGRRSSFLVSYTAAEIVTVKFGLSGWGDVQNNGNEIYSRIGYYNRGYDWETDPPSDWDGNVGTPLIIDAAVEATPIEGLRIALGAHAPTVSSNLIGADKDLDPRITLAVGVGMVENLNIGFRFGLSFLAQDKNLERERAKGFATYEDYLNKQGNAVGFTLGLGVDYTFDGPGVNIFLDVGYADGIWMKNNSAEGNDSFTIGAGVAKNFTNGSIGIAFAGTTNGDKYGRHALNEKSFAWEIPVKVTYSF